MSTTSSVYDGDGNLVSQTDGLGNITSQTFTPDDALATRIVTDVTMKAAVSSVAYRYDGDGNVLSKTDGDGNQTQWTYDGDQRVLTEESLDASGQAVQSKAYTYQPNETLTVDDLGYTTDDKYDAAHHLLSHVVSDPNNTVVRFESATYDLDGNLLTRTDADSTSTYAYDYAGRVTAETVSGSTPSGTLVVKNEHDTYDQNGNQLTALDGLGNLTTRTFDAMGRTLTEVVTDSHGTKLHSTT